MAAPRQWGSAVLGRTARILCEALDAAFLPMRLSPHQGQWDCFHGRQGVFDPLLGPADMTPPPLEALLVVRWKTIEGCTDDNVLTNQA